MMSLLLEPSILAIRLLDIKRPRKLGTLIAQSVCHIQLVFHGWLDLVVLFMGVLPFGLPVGRWHQTYYTPKIESVYNAGNWVLR